MILTLNNNTGGTLTYLGGSVSVAANSSLNLLRTLQVVITQDSGFYSDVAAGNLTLSDGVNFYGPADGTALINTLAQFIWTPQATAPYFYSLPVAIRQSAATASGGTVWTMRLGAGASRPAIIERIYLMMSFDSGTPLTRAFLKYDIERFTAATPSGGTSINVAQQDTDGLSTGIADARFLDTGLTTTGVSFQNVIATIGCPASDGASNLYVRENQPITLHPGQGLAIRLNGAAVAGQNLAGEVVWSERA